MGNKQLDALILMQSDNAGIFIPQQFIASIEGVAGWDIDPDDAAAVMKGPECEWYWEAWAAILDNAKYTAKDGAVYRLHQDGDLWAYCFERMTDEEKRNMGFED